MELPDISYTLKSDIPRIIAARIQYTMCDPMAIDPEEILPTLWLWCIGYDTKNKSQASCHELLELVQKEYGSNSIKELPTENEYSSYVIRLPNCLWYLNERENNTAYISPCRVKKSDRSLKIKAPESTLAYMRAFDQHIPQIHHWIDETVSQIAKENLLGDINAATSKAIIDKLINEEGLTIPAIIDIKGTHTGRVFIRFTTGEVMNCPLNYLRSRLIRRFKTGIHRKKQ